MWNLVACLHASRLNSMHAVMLTYNTDVYIHLHIHVTAGKCERTHACSHTHSKHVSREDVSRHMYIFIYTWICMGVSQQYKKRIGMSATPHSNSNQEIAPKTMVNMFVYVDYGHTPNIHTNKRSAPQLH